MAELPREQVVKVRAELDNAVVVRPGDKLVIATPGMVTRQHAAEMKQHLAELLPGVEGVIIGECSGLAVYRDERPDDAAVERWIHLNPQWFKEWVERYNRIAGIHNSKIK